jgi:hypothetical protein
MTTPTRLPSPLAHTPATLCPTCDDCPSCAGGTARIPTQYRVQKSPPGPTGVALHAICTRCNATGTTCPNLTPDRQETA